MRDTRFFAATARARVGFKHVACIASEQDRLFVAYAMGGGSMGAPGCISVPCGCIYGKRICWNCTGTGIGDDLIRCKQCDGSGSYFTDD